VTGSTAGPGPAPALERTVRAGSRSRPLRRGDALLRPRAALSWREDRRSRGVIRIIHGLWAQSTLTFSGRIYRADNAQIEPKPDHLIPICLGAFGDRALDLTGRLADGWIPSFGYAPPIAVTVMRDKILAAAHRAGRDPGEITCAYTMELCVGTDLHDPTIVSGTSGQVIEQLLDLTELGFTAMNFAIVGPDEQHQLEVLGHDIIPAIRAAT
jgi:alkanesulfonate monooxygenase SsuD/methylene tetrahydromethanopterin reductase-like flavin-dependent oxidoreductase (luciferase family)